MSVTVGTAFAKAYSDSKHDSAKEITTSETPENYVVAAGSDDKIVILGKGKDGGLTVRKRREITNAGVSLVRIRPDGLILAAGGWDYRIRLFSWKRPERC